MQEPRPRPVPVELPDHLAKIQVITDRKPWLIVYRQDGTNWVQKSPEPEPLPLDQVAVIERDRAFEKMKAMRFIVEIR